MWDWLEELMDFGGGDSDWSMVNDGVYNGNTGASDWSMINDGVDWANMSPGSYDQMDYYNTPSFMEDMYSYGGDYGGGYDMGELAFPSSYDYLSMGGGNTQNWSMLPDSAFSGQGSNGVFGNILEKLKKGVTGDNGNSLLKLGGGILASYLGNKSTANANQDQAKSNLANYLSNVTWTPEKSANYTNAVRANTSGVLSGALAQGRGTLAEQLASAGRGGGSFGKKNESMTREMLNKMASANNQAIQTVNTPPNLSAQAFAIPADTSTGNTLTGISGLLGNSYNQDATIKLLQQILAGL